MDFFKQLIVLVLIIAFGAGVYFGAFVPLAKSRSFIDAQRNIQTIQSTDDIARLYDVPLNISSPIGQEEVVKFTASTIGDILAQPGVSEPVARWLVSYIEPYLFPNELRHQMLLGNMYQFLWEQYGQHDEDFKKAEEAFLKGHELGPRTPPILYRLVDIYLKKGDMENARKYGDLILTYWPQDDKVRAAIGR